MVPIREILYPSLSHKVHKQGQGRTPAQVAIRQFSTKIYLENFNLPLSHI